MGPKVLVVDDEPDVCWALERALSSGCEVATTCSGREALALLAAGDYGLALVDAKLGDMDGMQLARTVSDLNAGIAVILVSGFLAGDDEAVQEGLASGVLSAFIAKPFSLEQVRRGVAEVLAAR